MKNGQSSYIGLQGRLQGRLNAHKSEFLNALKQRGKFIECCEEKGFMYSITIKAFGESYHLVIGLKNGFITLYQVKTMQQKAAV